jgi:hypothetical protein
MVLTGLFATAIIGLTAAAKPQPFSICSSLTTMNAEASQFHDAHSGLLQSPRLEE